MMTRRDGIFFEENFLEFINDAIKFIGELALN